MKVTVTTLELRDKITIASKALAKKSVKPILAGFLFEVKDGNFYICTTDLETGVKATVNAAEISGEARFVVPGDVIQKLVKVLPDDITELSLEGDVLVVSSGSTVFRITTMPADEFPEITPAESGITFEVDTSLLEEMVEKVIFAAAKDEFMRNLNGVFWELHKNLLRLVASDGFRLALAEEQIENEEEASFLLSLKSMKEVQNVLDNTTEPTITVRYDGRRVSLTTSDVETVMRVVDAEFPDYKRVIPETFKTKVVVSRKDLMESLRRVMVIATKGSESVKFEIEENVMRLVSKSPDYGEVVDEVEVQKEGEDLVIAFNPKFIEDVLKHIETEEIEMNFVDSTSPCQINPLDISGYLYIVMPIRLA
ncbi:MULTISPECIES: DNA polymerase III subunit beta [unclassified Thermotoga]|uniref:DNA polymerase III subunit beta n=1 Tax=unclassified Thermotoga TaxID=2631113 RepID=UPI000540DF2D|nr:MULTISPECIES: DNA polymerase III subunit beta [unclassified Thermotoga]AIY87999.1 DNA polymerase III, beta subunit [Thermotoga sp. Cell2]KHC91076.1 DNA polymerase III subunit beta [Thermotoga sp. TBGT1765]KHC91989.1 DNA polymerase III subunit beta [Thermotoga sp. TBGT1766]KHC96717.1 DNA polymerase III subunit beta [Thermotoga sp. Xyl54]